MRKEEFLSELERRLSVISEEERTEAMAFYRSYLEDAGEENEEAVIAELESPQKIAESILNDLGVEVGAEPETVDVYEAKERVAEAAHEIVEFCDGANKQEDTNSYYNTSDSQQTGYYNQPNESYGNSYDDSYSNQQKNNAGMNALLIVLAVLTAPIWLTVLAGVASVLFGFICTVFGIMVAVVAAMVTLIVTGIVLAVVGIGTTMGGNPAAGIGLMGGGFIVLALGVLALVLVVWVFGTVVPWLVKGIVKLCRKPFDKRKERMAA